MSLAVLALLGNASAEEARHKIYKTKGYQEFTVDEYGYIALGETTVVRRESDHVANGDLADDKELEDETDPDDAIVQDTGYGHLWV